MSSNNFPPNADIPVAIPVNEIPVAIPVGIPVQEHIPVAVPVQEEIPIAVPIDERAREAEIRNLQDRNQQMADKAKRLEEKLRAEKRKQEEQQRKLQQTQDKLKQQQRADAALEETNRELRWARQQQLLEAEFSLEQTRLLNEYVNRINLASEYRVIGNFDKAIQEYNVAIHNVQKLISAYKDKEFHKGNYFATIPANYNNSIQSAQLEIANCLISKGQLEHAYDHLAKIPRGGSNSYVIDAKASECRNLIAQKAQSLIARASMLHAYADPVQMAEALSMLDEAQRLQRKISQTEDKNCLKLKATFEWALKRNNVNKECLDFLGTKHVLSEYGNALKQCKAIIAEYDKHSTVLSSDDLTYRAKMQNVLPMYEQVDAQLKINASLTNYEQYLLAGDLVRAHSEMAAIHSLSRRITNPAYIRQVGLNYTSADNYYRQLKSIEADAQQFKERANLQHSGIVELILKAALTKISTKTPNASLLEKDVSELRAALATNVKENWHKFDRRSEPQDLISAIATTIARNTEDIGVLKKWYHWSYATSTLNDRSKTLDAIKAQISAYVPVMLPEAAIQFRNS